MPGSDDEEQQLLEVLKLMDAHRNGELDADQLEEAIWRVRNPHAHFAPRWLWLVIVALLIGAGVLYSIA